MTGEWAAWTPPRRAAHSPHHFPHRKGSISGQILRSDHRRHVHGADHRRARPDLHVAIGAALMAVATKHTARIMVDGWPLAFDVDRGLGIVYPLTSCCQAAANRGHCSKCGVPVDERFDMGWTIENAADTLLCPVCTDTHHWCPQSPLHGRGRGFVE